MKYTRVTWVWSWLTLTLGIVVVIILLSTTITAGKRVVPFGRVGSDLGDYRLSNGEPFVTLFEHENYRGKIFRQRVRKECSNIPFRYWDWSSSVNLHGRCVTLCDTRDCTGSCVNLYPGGDQKGVKRLNVLGINDKAKSVKFCYQQFG